MNNVYPGDTFVDDNMQYLFIAINERFVCVLVYDFWFDQHNRLVVEFWDVDEFHDVFNKRTDSLLRPFV